MQETPFGPKSGPGRHRRFNSDATAALADAWNCRMLRCAVVLSLLFSALASVLRYRGQVALVPFLVFGAVIFVIAFVDVQTGFVPNVILYPASVIGAITLVAAAIIDGDGSGETAATIARVALGAVLSFGCAHLVWKVTRGGIGYGDVRFCGYLGAHVAYATMWAVPAMFLASSAIASLLGVIVLVFKLRTRARRGQYGVTMLNIIMRARETRFPLAPALSFGAWMAVSSPGFVLWPFGLDLTFGLT